MASSILVAYATRYGSTKEIADEISAALREAGLTVDMLPFKDVRSLEGYGAVVMGAPLQMYKWHKDALNFLSKQRKTLEKMPVAVFAVGPVQSPRVEQEWVDARTQIDKVLAAYPWFKPAAVGVLGGDFNPEKLSGLMKTFAKAAPASSARDTEAVKAWVRGVVERLNLPG